jgi:hypothetical protein
MGFESVTDGKTFKPNKELEVGESITGYVLGFREGKHGQNLLMQIDGEPVTVFSAGNIRYAIRDGKIAVGALTRITRKEDEKVKGMNSSKFSIEQDRSDTVDTSNFDAVFDSEENKPSTGSSVKAATDKGIAAASARLAGVAGGRK